ncbi:MAG: hypothetical protein ACMUJM_07720 [bacterium]
MYRDKKIFLLLFPMLIIVSVIAITPFSSVHAQAYWTALPPYNLLWPLWSPVLSPPDPATGVPTPIVTDLTPATVLPVEPVLAWDPVKPVTWALFNIPPMAGGGLLYFNMYYGFGDFPPSYLVDPATGSPLPITLPPDYTFLPPLGTRAELPNILGANLFYLALYPPFLFGTDPASLLTVSDIWGLTL